MCVVVSTLKDFSVDQSQKVYDAYIRYLSAVARVADGHSSQCDDCKLCEVCVGRRQILCEDAVQSCGMQGADRGSIVYGGDRVEGVVGDQSVDLGGVSPRESTASSISGDGCSGRSGGEDSISRSGICDDRSGLLLSARGKNYERNKASRDRKARALKQAALDKKEGEKTGDSSVKYGQKKRAMNLDWRKSGGEHVGFFSACDRDVQVELRESRARMLIERNRREQAEDLHKFNVLKGADVDAEIRKHRAQVTAATERSLVSIEKAHATLVSTGNVPGEVGGFAQTIVGSGSISPNSSASLQEFRKCQKDLLDSEEYNARLVATLKEFGIEVPHTAQSDREHNRELGIWTDNSENMQIVREQYPDCDILRDVHGIEGKMKVIPAVDYY